MSSDPIPIPEWVEPTHVPAEELARRQGIRPVADVRDLAIPGFFASDEELDEFLTWIYTERRRGYE